MREIWNVTNAYCTWERSVKLIFIMHSNSEDDTCKREDIGTGEPFEFKNNIYSYRILIYYWDNYYQVSCLKLWQNIKDIQVWVLLYW